ncbi:hypothetical protein ACFWY6_04710 [Streptomyces sp. NPDC059037]|uniref:hypothetical protein n=1 Tax=Streptomyces sp. NPDC059037 TaxID=3346710 RepID=UPI0036968A85
METEDRRSRHQQLVDALRPEAKAAPLPRRAVRADLLLAVVLTVIALFVAVRYPGDGPVSINPPDGRHRNRDPGSSPAARPW